MGAGRRQSRKALLTRPAFISAADDAALRQLAHEAGMTRSELIRTAVSLKLAEWEGAETEAVLNELRKAGGEPAPASG